MDCENKKVFRTRIFGGFNKTDVLNYIESAARKAKEESDSLKKEIESKDKEIQEIQAQSTQLNEKTSLLEQDSIKKDEEAASLKDQLETAEKTIAELQKKIEQYDRLKADIAGIELSARKRAKEVERESLNTLEKMRVEADQILQATKDRFTGFVESVGEQVTNAESTLDSAKNGYKTLLSGLSTLKEMIYGLKPEEESKVSSCILSESASLEKDETETDHEPDTEQLLYSYIEETVSEPKHLSLKEMMERLKNK